MTYQIREGSRTIPLTIAEARTLIRGEIPPVLARTLAERGLELPKRGTRAMTLMIPHDLGYQENTCYARIARAA